MSIIDTLVGLSILSTAAAGFWRWGMPRVRARIERQRSIEAVLLGRPESHDKVTGERRTEMKGLGDRLNELAADLKIVHHEVQTNSGSSLKDAVKRQESVLNEIRDRLAVGDERFTVLDAAVTRLQESIDSELHTANDAVANAAEANKVVLTTIGDAIRATPPTE